VVAALFAALVGVPLMRLAGTTASVATLMLLLIVQIVASNWSGFTGGQQSVLGVPADVDITKAFIGLVVAVLIAALYQVTPSARRLRASREDEVAAAAVGVHVARERWIAFVVSALLAGMSGGMWTHVIGPYGALSFSLELTFMSVAMLIIGGMLSLTGAVAGVVVVTVLGEIPRHVEALPSGSTPFIVSLAMLVVLLLRPSGITGGREVPWPRRRSRPDAVAATALEAPS
jgi:branched-chain amino acid transport system permease protein